MRSAALLHFDLGEIGLGDQPRQFAHDLGIDEFSALSFGLPGSVSAIYGVRRALLRAP